MTVRKTDIKGVSIHEYHRLVGTGNAAIDSDAFDWLRAVHTGTRWLLRGDATYRTNRAIDLQDLGGQEIFGQSSATSQIIAENLDQPIFNLRGVQQDLRHFLAAYSQIPASANANAFNCTGNWNNSVLDHIRVFRVNRTISADAGTFFSNDIRSVRTSNWTDWAIHIGGTGTGNHFQNIFNNTAANGSATGGFYARGLSQTNLDQVNVEGGRFSRACFEFEDSSISANSLHMEGASVASEGFIRLTGGRTNVTVHNPTFSRIDQEAGLSQGLFYVDGFPNTSGSVNDSRQQLHVTGCQARDNTTSVSGSLYEVVGNPANNFSRDSVVKMQNTMRESGSSMVVVGGLKVRSNNLDDRAFRQFDDEWFTLQNGTHSTASAFYRYTAGAGGALTPTAV